MSQGVESPTGALNRQLDHLGAYVRTTGRKIPKMKFIDAVMGGGFSDLVSQFGGRTLAFHVKTATGDEMLLQEYPIPNFGARENLRGFLFAADNGTETLVGHSPTSNIDMFQMLDDFFDGIYNICMVAYMSGNDIEVRLV
jgi:hypothetical protein